MNQKLYVLIIEDSQEDTELIVNLLRKEGYDISYRRVEMEDGMKRALEDQHWDLILSDYSMPSFDVPSALEIYHKSGADIPFVVISGAIGEDKAVEMIKAGARDYLLKDNMTRFASVVERELREARVRKELVKANEKLELLNQHQIDAREEERALISLEIHDELGQSLTALKLDLNWVRGNISDKSNSIEKLNKMVEMTDDIIKKVQRISSELRPGLLDDLGLASTIEWYCDEFEERTGIKCNLDLEDLPFGDSKTDLALFRILQEALTNVIRHSEASSVDIEIHHSEQVLTMTIEDNGIGIPFEKLELGTSLGLAGIRERARHCGGTVEFVSEEGKGTKIIIVITRQQNKIA